MKPIHFYSFLIILLLINQRVLSQTCTPTYIGPNIPSTNSVYASCFDPNDSQQKKVWRLSDNTISYNNDITDANDSWTIIDDSFTVKSYRSIVFHPTNPQIAYIGCYTGGIYKTTNGGQTWSLISLPSYTYTNLQKLGIDSNGTLYKIDGWGFAKSIDGGLTWTNGTFPTSQTSGFSDMEIGRDGTVYLSNYNGELFKSGTGSIFDRIYYTSGVSMDIALASSTQGSSQVIYIVVSNYGSVVAVRKSSNGGSTWQSLSIPTHLGYEYAYGDVQNKCMVVSPTDPNILILKGQKYMVKSINGGTTWNYTPSDYHIWRFNAVSSSTPTRFVGSSDWTYKFGMDYSDDIFSNSTTFTYASRNNNLQDANVTSCIQKNHFSSSETIFSIAGNTHRYVAPSGTDTTVLQSGSPIYDSDEWERLLKVNSSIDQYTGYGTHYLHTKQANKLYSFVVYNYIYDDKENNLIYREYNTSTGLKIIRDFGRNHTESTLTSSVNFSQYTLLNGKSANKLFAWNASSKTVLDLTLSGNTLTVSKTFTIPLTNLTGIVEGNTTNELIIYQDYYIYYSSDRGSTWRGVGFSGSSTGMPWNTYTYSLVMNPSNSKQVVIGTNKGLFYTNDISATTVLWQQCNDIPKIPINSLSFRYENNDLLIATNGRGILKSSLFTTTFTPQLEFTNLKTNYCKGKDYHLGFLEKGNLSNTSFRLELSDATGSFSNISFSQTVTESPFEFNFLEQIPNGSNYKFRIVTTANNTPLLTSTMFSISGNPSPFVTGYPQVMNQTQNGFMVKLKTTATTLLKYVLVPKGQPMPSIVQIERGHNAYDNLALKTAYISTGANSETNLPIQTLPPSSAFDLYFISKTTSDDCYSFPVKLEVNTLNDESISYCVPTHTMPCGNNKKIDWVKMTPYYYQENYLSTSTGCSPNGYSFYPTTFQIFKNYAISLNSSTTITAWIDLNRDGEFTSNENTSNYTNTFNEIHVPSTALSGYTRLRVRSGYSLTDPCSTMLDGETEDYWVYIYPVTGDEILFNANVAITNVLPAQNLTIYSDYLGYFENGDTYNIELSDSNGHFAPPQVLASNQPKNNTLTVQIPANTPIGNNYRIRLISNNPYAVSTPSATFIIGNPCPELLNISTNYLTEQLNFQGQNIISNSKIENTARITVSSEKAIILTNGFLAQPTAGGTVILSMEGCPN